MFNTIILKSKWTSLEKINGWSHYEVLSLYKKTKKIELFSVCDKKIRIKINLNELKNKEKWLKGWKLIVKKDS